MLQCVTVCCGELQGVTGVLWCVVGVLQCVAVCCSVLRCVAACCWCAAGVLQVCCRCDADVMQ